MQLRLWINPFHFRGNYAFSYKTEYLPLMLLCSFAFDKIANIFFFSIWIVGGGVHIGCSRDTAAMYWPIEPVPGDFEDGEVGGMKCGWQGKPKYSEKTCPDATLSTTNPTCQTRARIRAAAVGSLRLTA
jgi:hypothetical protein